MKYLAECELTYGDYSLSTDLLVNTNTKETLPIKHYKGYSEDGDGVVVICNPDTYHGVMSYTVIKLKDMSEIDDARIKLKLYV